jgi:YggT family protein
VSGGISLGGIVYLLLSLYTFALIARIVLEYLRMFARSWQPRGIILLLAELVFTITDPPLRFVRRFVPPLRLGAISLDLSFLVVFFAVSLLMQWIPPLLP